MRFKSSNSAWGGRGGGRSRGRRGRGGSSSQATHHRHKYKEELVGYVAGIPEYVKKCSCGDVKKRSRGHKEKEFIAHQQTSLGAALMTKHLDNSRPNQLALIRVRRDLAAQEVAAREATKARRQARTAKARAGVGQGARKAITSGRTAGRTAGRAGKAAQGGISRIISKRGRSSTE